MESLFEPYTRAFQSVSLDELNQSAALLDRQENKYLLEPGQFLGLIDELAEQFNILSINGQRQFNYKSLYFDSDDLVGYTYHNQGRTKRRFKVRTRSYVDSDLCFFEVKLKDKRGGTIKKRIPYEPDDYRTMTDQARAFLDEVYFSVYGLRFEHELAPQIEIGYNRITLVAKDTAERMTIDFNLTFSGRDKTLPVRPMLIIETKSPTGRGIADGIMRAHNIKPRSCSKFCLGANLLAFKVKHNRFKPLLKHYQSLPVFTALNSNA